MKRILVASAFLASTSVFAQTAPSQATVDAHVAEAKRLAGSDLGALMVLCTPAPASRPPQAAVDASILKNILRPAPAPGKAFDNLYFVGGAWASAWALTTPEGIILIDALNNEDEAKALIDGGMRKLGLDPARIKYVIVTHAHGDHYGGAEYLIKNFKPRIVMSEPDWVQTETKLEFNSPHWGPVPKRDLSVKDGDRISLGGASVTINVTPGHTLGTITPSFEVPFGVKTHKVIIWGGTAFNFGNNVPRMDTYIEATRRMAKMAQEQGIDVMLSNHAGYDGTIAKLDALAKSG